MLRQMSCVVIFTAAAAAACAANASTTQPDAGAAAASTYWADPRGSLWSEAARTAAGSGARASAARTALFCAHDDRGAALNRHEVRLVLDAEDHREEYEGLLTDAILRLIKDLRPQLARR